jgi:hypothetical protein
MAKKGGTTAIIEPRRPLASEIVGTAGFSLCDKRSSLICEFNGKGRERTHAYTIIRGGC